MPSGISPETVAGIARELELTQSSWPLLRAWWNEIEQWERESCAEIADALDSGRGNEKEIARAIRKRT